MSKPIGTLSPAYGRDYTSASVAERDFLNNKDFILNPSMQYISMDSYQPGDKVSIRYNKLRSITLFTVPSLETSSLAIQKKKGKIIISVKNTFKQPNKSQIRVLARFASSIGCFTFIARHLRNRWKQAVGFTCIFLTVMPIIALEIIQQPEMSLARSLILGCEKHQFSVFQNSMEVRVAQLTNGLSFR